MAQHQFAGSVTVNGSARRLAINGNPLGRTVILVDGVTAYDKKPFIHKETIDFDIVPGKQATLRWQQVSLTGMECDITVDGRTTTVPAVTSSGAPGRPVSAKQRQEFKMRAIGAGISALGIVLLVLNYGELRSNGHYYPKYLFIAPALFVNGLIFLARPSLDLSPPPRYKAFLAFQAALLVLCWFFERWFVGFFGPQ